MDDLNKKYYELDELPDDLDNDNSNINDEENCINCYYSNLGYCPIKNKYINEYTPLCWSYRNWLTMRASSDFQDDNEDFYEYEQGE